MATDKQIAANRANAKKSTGPRSQAGKAKSSQNALKTGIDAKSEVLRIESRAEHDELCAAFHASFAPATAEEVSMVDALIRFEWLSRRYACVDVAVFENRFTVMEPRSLGEVYMDQANKICRAVAAFNSVRRGFNATLKQLNQLQAKRLAEAPPELQTIEPTRENQKSASILKFPDPLPDRAPAAGPKPLPETGVALPVITLYPHNLPNSTSEPPERSSECI